ncbi:chorismate synthase [Mesonia sp. K4-1]|uniref:chorismate synthase n=1 Tax=Mesonia sp. K4-1 TaxID=2602760 RepID=UPI0011C8F95A|nr:chorismate synthase [Mesonia sp. K4-1]TXK76533.1 chorismate synthase [Mesonia sp. K4-1]
MAGNSIGTLFQLTTFGESHGEALGGIIEGCPSGVVIDFDFIQKELKRRKPGQSKIVTQRKEADEVEFYSGIFEGKTTGTPIGFVVKNTNQKSKDYDHIKDVYRPSHADFTYDEKYGERDYRGGGRSSARETVCRVVAGAIAKLFLTDIKITAYTSGVGEIQLTEENPIDFTEIENNVVRCPNANLASKMESLITSVKKEGDSLGGIISCVIENVPTGLGEPVFDKLHANLGKAMLSINAVKGFEYGSGFEGSKMRGSEHNDAFTSAKKTTTNYSGGIQGGISNGMPIYFKVAFKPVATLIQKQTTINNKGETVEMQGKGRHDPCVVPRAVPIVEAMAALVLADFILLQRRFNS